MAPIQAGVGQAPAMGVPGHGVPGPRAAGEIVGTLFLSEKERDLLVSAVDAEPDMNDVWPAELEVSAEEMQRTFWRMSSRKAPAPECSVLISRILGFGLRQLFDCGLQSGTFPLAWNVRRMVLIPKERRPVDSVGAYRLYVCSTRLANCSNKYSHAASSSTCPGLDRNWRNAGRLRLPGRALHGRCGRPYERPLGRACLPGGEVTIAVSQDIVNAFNTLP